MLYFFQLDKYFFRKDYFMSTVSSTSRTSDKSRSISTHSLVLMGVSAAVLTVISQISIPMPTGVPVTIQLFGIALVGTILGWKQGAIATLVYIFLGCAGLPVFSNFRGGLQCLTGMTGGYILAWPVMAAVSGIRVKDSSQTVVLLASIALSVKGLMIV